jgi:hypothetical protein
VIKLKKIKKVFLFTIFAAMFLTFLSLNVSASVWEVRSLPTVYKVTGNITLNNTSGYLFLVGYVSDGAENFPLATSNVCKEFNNFENDLKQGIFVGPLNSELPGLERNEKNFDFKMAIYKYANEDTCNADLGQAKSSVNSNTS